MAAAGGKKLMYSELYKKSQTRGAFDDLVLLDKADNEEIVQVLSTRFMKGDMYTSVGKVLVAVNPYQQLQKGGESIYAEGVARHYFSQDRLV
jgi:myosin heavy subunit